MKKIFSGGLSLKEHLLLSGREMGGSLLSPQPTPLSPQGPRAQLAVSVSPQAKRNSAI